MVPADSGRIPRVPPYSGSRLDGGAGTSRTGLSPSAGRLSSRFRCPPPPSPPAALLPRPPRLHGAGLGCCAFARRYWRNRVCFLLLRVLRCFSSPGSLPGHKAGMTASAAAGLPHSEIRASQGMCPSARLIAACRVLPRLREPRHPSCALVSFPFFFHRRLAVDRRRRQGPSAHAAPA